MKRCPACGKRKPLDAFYRYGKGRPTAQRQAYCRAGMRSRQRAAIEYSKRWIQDFARRWCIRRS